MARLTALLLTPGSSTVILFPGMEALSFARDLLFATFGQIITLFGTLIAFGSLMHFISRFTSHSLSRAFGTKGIYSVAWLGTPVHEFGHLLFCFIFAHKVMEVQFFKPDPLTGALGYVRHKWNSNNPWQVIGNFFIGIGPIVIGSVALFALFYLLIPDGSEVWRTILGQVYKVQLSDLLGSYIAILRDSLFALLHTVFTASNITSWRFWVFLYISISIASSIRLSTSDLKHSLSGLGCVVLPLLIINLLGMANITDPGYINPFITSSLVAITSLLVLALLLSLIGFLVTYLMSAIYVKIRYRYLLNPF